MAGANRLGAYERRSHVEALVHAHFKRPRRHGCSNEPVRILSAVPLVRSVGENAHSRSRSVIPGRQIPSWLQRIFCYLYAYCRHASTSDERKYSHCTARFSKKKPPNPWTLRPFGPDQFSVRFPSGSSNTLIHISSAVYKMGDQRWLEAAAVDEKYSTKKFDRRRTIK